MSEPTDTPAEGGVLKEVVRGSKYRGTLNDGVHQKKCQRKTVFPKKKEDARQRSKMARVTASRKTNQRKSVMCVSKLDCMANPAWQMLTIVLEDRSTFSNLLRIGALRRPVRSTSKKALVGQE